MCRWALISWPIETMEPCGLYIILGELYNNEVKNNREIMSNFCKELKYLYPFRYSMKLKKCYNIEDIYYFRKKYNLTINIQLVGKAENNIITFRTPVLYDIDCLVPIFLPRYFQSCYNINKNFVCIIFPCKSPVKRGQLLEEVIIYGPEYFVVMGDKYGENKDSTATLMTRFLLCKKIPYKNIIKIKHTASIVDAVEIINIAINKEYSLIIACQNDIIRDISKEIKVLKYHDVIKCKVYYVCN